MKHKKPESLDVQCTLSDTSRSWVTGRNGTRTLTKIRLWGTPDSAGEGYVSLDTFGKSQDRALNAGIGGIPRLDFVTFCINVVKQAGWTVSRNGREL